MVTLRLPSVPVRTLRHAFLLVLGTLLAARPLQAQETLTFFKNYFVTGDYTVGGVALRGTGVSGIAKGNIPIAGVPATADILAALLYWQTVTTANTGVNLSGAKFRGESIGGLAKVVNPSGSAPCWSSGGATGSSNGAHVMISYRADVLRFLGVDPATGKLQVNTSHPVELPDSGATGNTVPSTGGATLVIVYRNAVKEEDLRSIVIYNGGLTVDRGNRGADLTLGGFYQASSVAPRAKMTPILGDGQDNFSEQVFLNSQPLSLDPPASSTNPFTKVWENPTFDVSAAIGQNASQATMGIRPVGSSLDCLSFSAVVLSTTVQDTDRDGLLDKWESSTAPLFQPAGPLPDLKAMGASPTVPDIFVQIDYMTAGGYSNPAQGPVAAHSHLPSKAALDMVAKAFRDPLLRPAGVPPINIHFDVGDNYQSGIPTVAQCAANWQPSCAIIKAGGTARLARGGHAMPETACVSSASVTCQFPDYPGTVGWKSAFRFYRDKPVANGVSEQACVAAGASCERNFDRNRKDIFRYALFAHAVGLPRADVDDLGTAIDERHTPKNTSGIADPPGGDLMVTLGFWDNFVGSDFIQASTLLHELGHTIGLRHGGPPKIVNGAVTLQANCRPNYQSVMNYLFQIRGLVTADGVPVVAFSKQALGVLDEHKLSETAGMGQFAYLPRWYAPKASSFLDTELGTTPATRRCDGSKPIAGDVDMVRIDGTSVPAAPAIDWNADGTIASGLFAQDVNFSGVCPAGSSCPPTPLDPLTDFGAGSDDFAVMDLRQVGGRRGTGSERIGGAMSLDMGFADVGFADVGFGDVGFADVGFADVGFADVGFGDVGFADVGFGDVGFGDVGFADVGAPLGDLDMETATALGNAPHSLKAVVGKQTITLDWKAPHVGAPFNYELYRVIGTAVTPATLGSRVLLGPVPATGPTTFVDATVKNNTTYTYFVIANLSDATQTGTSNMVTVTK